MADRGGIDGYIADLRRQLDGVAWWRRRGVISEIRGHLEDAAAEERRAAGESREEAERRAVERFGSPVEVARQFARPRRRRGVWAAASAALVLAVGVGVLLVAHQSTGPARIVGVEQETVNLGRLHYRIVASADPGPFEVPLSWLKRWLPSHPPVPLPQSERCPNKHLIVRYVMSDGSTVTYGPCQIPAQVGVVRHNLALAYGRSHIAQKLELRHQDTLQRRVIAMPTVPRPSVAPVRVTGGSPAQRREILRLARRLPPGVLPAPVFEIDRHALAIPLAAASRDNPRATWPEIMTRWAGELVFDAYRQTRIGRAQPLKVLRVGGRQANEGLGPSASGSVAAMRRAVARAAHHAGLQVVRADVIPLAGGHPYIELRASDPRNADQAISRFDLAWRWRQGGELVVTNPCRVPIGISTQLTGATQFWSDPAWLTFSGSTIGPTLQRSRLRPATACG